MTTDVQRPEKFFLEKFGLTERTLDQALGPRWGSGSTMPTSISNTG